MTFKHLFRLAIVAAVALVLALWSGVMRQPGSSFVADQNVIPKLSGEINQVKTIRALGAENKILLTLERGDDGWLVVEKNNYPADLQKIREFLLSLAEAKLLESKTADPNLHSKLGVEDVTAATAKGVLVELLGLSEPANIIIGNYNGGGGGGTFVRHADQAQSYLAKGSISIDKTAANWLRKELIDIDVNRVREATINAAGKTLRVFKGNAADANFQIADVPKNREVASDFVANSVSSVLMGLNIEDVRAAGEVDAGVAQVYESTFRTFDGVVINASAWESDNKAYANFNAQLDETALDSFVAREQAKAVAVFQAQRSAYEEKLAQIAADSANAKSGDEASANQDNVVKQAVNVPEEPKAPMAVSDASKDSEARKAAINEEVAALQQRFEGWTFVIPSYKFGSMNKSMEDMLKPLDTTAK